MDVYRTNPKLFNDTAEFLKALSHPQRLCIVKTLCEKGQSNVTAMQDCLDEPQAKVSQHLQKLKAARMIKGQRDGTSIIYSIRDEETKDHINAIIREFFTDSNQKHNNMKP